MATPNPYYQLFVNAFQTDFPDVKVNVIFKGTADVLKQVLAEKAAPTIDVWWGGGIDAFLTAKKQDLLQNFTLDPARSDNAINFIPKEAAGLPLYDPQSFYYGYTIGGFGIMSNTQYLSLYKLPEPKEWSDLTAPSYRNHISMADPRHSGSTLAIVEIILQGLGWQSGWKLLKEIAANMGSFTGRSSEVPDLVQRGSFGVGLVIDFFAFSSQQQGFPVKFIYPSVTIFNADSIALIKNAPHSDLGKLFINWVLSRKAQTLLYDKTVFRAPIRTDIYSQAPPGFPNPFQQTLKITYNSSLGASRNIAVPNLFGSVIIDRHSDLVAAWDKIATGSAAVSAAPPGSDLSRAQTFLQSAIDKFAGMPIDEASASATSSKMAADVTFLAQTTTSWDQFARAQYASALSDAQGALAAIPAVTTTTTTTTLPTSTTTTVIVPTTGPVGPTAPTTSIYAVIGSALGLIAVVTAVVFLRRRGAA